MTYIVFKHVLPSLQLSPSNRLLMIFVPQLGARRKGERVEWRVVERRGEKRRVVERRGEKRRVVEGRGEKRRAVERRGEWWRGEDGGSERAF